MPWAVTVGAVLQEGALGAAGLDLCRGLGLTDLPSPRSMSRALPGPASRVLGIVKSVRRDLGSGCPHLRGLAWHFPSARL